MKTLRVIQVLATIVLALSFMRTSTILFFVTILTYTVLLVAVADTFFMYRSLKKKLAANEDKP